MNASKVVFHVPTRCDPEEAVLTAKALHPALDSRKVRRGDKVFSPVTELLLLVDSASPFGADTVTPDTVFEIHLPKRPIEERYDTLVLLDASPSMDREDVEPTRYDAAVTAVERFLANAAPFVARAGLASFGKGFRLLQDLVPLAECDPAKAHKIPLTGPAHTMAAVEAGVEHLLRHGDPGLRKALVVVTGEVEEGPLLLEPVARTARLAGIEIHVALLGATDTGWEWLSHLAQTTGGSCAQAGSADALHGAFERMAEAAGLERDWGSTARLRAGGLIEQEPEVEVVVRPVEEEAEAPDEDAPGEKEE